MRCGLPALLWLALLLLAGCRCSGDAPLYRTALPGGYSFHSNGGIYGYVRDPSGTMLSGHFGIQDDGSERWCNEFGWSGVVAVCALERIEARTHKTIAFGYYVIDTSRGEIQHLADDGALGTALNALSVAGIPRMATVHDSTARLRIKSTDNR